MDFYILAILVVWFATFLANFTIKDTNLIDYEFIDMLKEGYNHSSLRVFWKGLYFVVVYILGLAFLLWLKSAELPAMYIKKLLKFLFFTEKK